MKIQITTTVTTLIDVDTFEPEHSVEIESDTDIGQTVVLNAALGALRSAEKKVESMLG